MRCAHSIRVILGTACEALLILIRKTIRNFGSYVPRMAVPWPTGVMIRGEWKGGGGGGRNAPEKRRHHGHVVRLSLKFIVQFKYSTNIQRPS